MPHEETSSIHFDVEIIVIQFLNYYLIFMFLHEKNGFAEVSKILARDFSYRFENNFICWIIKIISENFSNSNKSENS